VVPSVADMFSRWIATISVFQIGPVGYSVFPRSGIKADVVYLVILFYRIRCFLIDLTLQA